MALTLRPRRQARWIAKPALQVGINRDHPLGTKILSCWILNEGVGQNFNDIARKGARDWTNDSIRPASGGNYWGARFPLGVCVVGNGSNQGARQQSVSSFRLTGRTAWTVLAVMLADTLTTDRVIFTSHNGSNGWQLQTDSTDATRLWLRIDGNSHLSGTGALAAGILLQIAATYDGDRYRTYVNGIEVYASAGSQAAVAAEPLSTAFGISTGDLNGWNGPLFHCCAWEEALRGRALLDLVADPYAFLNPPRPFSFPEAPPEPPVVVLPPNLRTVLEEDPPNAHPVLELDLPDGTHRYAEAGIASDSEGLYEPLIAEGGWGETDVGVSHRRNDLELPEITVAVDDTDLVFSKLLEGQHGYALRGSVARVRILSPNLAPADWLTAYTGRLNDWTKRPGRQWELRLRPNDLPLIRDFPRIPITRNDWPDAHQDAIGEIAPLVYGEHSSVGYGEKGMLPTLYVDRVNFRFLVGRGALVDVMRVYVDGVAVATGWAKEYVTTNGRLFTCVKFDADPAPDPEQDVEVTVDAKGLELNGDGSGPLITNPARALRHWIVAFLYNEYATGAYPADSTVPVDTDYFLVAEDFFAKKEYRASYYLGRVSSGHAEVNAWANSLGCKLFWTPEGKIAPVVEDPAFTDLYNAEAPWFRGGVHEKGDSFSIDYDHSTVVAKYITESAFSEVDGKYQLRLEVGNPALTDGGSENLPLPWSARHVL